MVLKAEPAGTASHPRSLAPRPPRRSEDSRPFTFPQPHPRLLQWSKTSPLLACPELVSIRRARGGGGGTPKSLGFRSALATGPAPHRGSSKTRSLPRPRTSLRPPFLFVGNIYTRSERGAWGGCTPSTGQTKFIFYFFSYLRRNMPARFLLVLLCLQSGAPVRIPCCLFPIPCVLPPGPHGLGEGLS